MKKAYIYFKGDIINTVICDGIHKDMSQNATILIKTNDDNTYTSIAVIPFDHLIIFRDIEDDFLGKTT